MQVSSSPSHLPPSQQFFRINIAHTVRVFNLKILLLLSSQWDTKAFLKPIDIFRKIQKNKDLSYPFACLSQSSLRSGLTDSGSAALWISASLLCSSQPHVPWKITSGSLLKKVYLTWTRKSPAYLSQVSISTNLGSTSNRQKNFHW